MAEKETITDMQTGFEQVTEVINTMRAQNALATVDTEKLLNTINLKLDALSDDENTDLIKVFLGELKRGLDEKHNFISMKFSQIEDSFTLLEKQSAEALKGAEVKSLFDIIATNLNIFSKEVIDQKDVLSNITFQIQELQTDESRKEEIVKNISALKADIDRLNNGFESIILNVNDNFKSLSQILAKTDTNDKADAIKKDIENIFLSTNAVLSALQVIDRKNREFEEVLETLTTKDDNEATKAQIVKLIAKNEEMNDFILALSTKDDINELSQKTDTALGIMAALKQILTDANAENSKLLLAQIGELELTIKKIISQEDFIAFKEQLLIIVQDVVQSSNLMRGDLLETNSALANLVKLLSAIDIKANFQALTGVVNNAEDSIKESVYELSNKFSQESDANTNRIINDLTENIKILSQQLKTTEKSIQDGEKLNTAEIADNIEIILNKLANFKSEMHSENVQNLDVIEEKLQGAKDDILSTKDILVTNSKQNAENILENILAVGNALEQLSQDFAALSKGNFEELNFEIASVKDQIENIKAEISIGVKADISAVSQDLEDISEKIFGLKAEIGSSNQILKEGLDTQLEDLNKLAVKISEQAAQNGSFTGDELRVKLQEIETTLSQGVQTHDVTLFNLQSKLDEYFATVQSVSASSNERIENSLADLTGVKSDIDEISAQISSLNDESGNKLDGLKESTTEKFEELNTSLEALQSGVKTSSTANLQTILETLDKSFSGISEELEKFKTDELISSGIETLENALNDIQADVTEAAKEIQKNIDDKNLLLKNDFELVKSTIEKLVDADFEGMIKDVKVQVAKSYLTVATTIKDSIAEESLKSTENVDSYFADFNKKLDKTQADFSTNSTKICNDMLTSFEKLNTCINDLYGLKEELITEIQTIKSTLRSDLASEVLEVKDTLKEGLIDELADVKYTVKEDLVQELENVKAAISDEASQYSADTCEKIKESIADANKTLSAEIAEAKEGVEKTFGEAKETLLDKFLSFGKEAKEGFEKSLAAVKEELAEKFQAPSGEQLSKEISQIGEKLSDKIEEIKPLTKDDLVENLTQTSAELKEELEKAGAETKEDVTALGESLTEKVSSGVAALKETMKEENSSQALLLREDFGNILKEINKLQALLQSVEETSQNLLDENSKKKDKSDEIAKNKELEVIKATVEELSAELDAKLKLSETSYTGLTQTLLNDVKASFTQNLEENIEELKAYVEMITSKENITTELDSLKGEMTDKFADVEYTLEKTFSSLDLKDDLANVSDKITDSVSSSLEDFNTRVTEIFEANDLKKEFEEKNNEFFQTINELKENLLREFLEKIDAFNADRESQRRDFEGAMTQMKQSIDSMVEDIRKTGNESRNDIAATVSDFGDEINGLKQTLYVKDDVYHAKDEIVGYFSNVANAVNELKEDFGKLDFNTIVENHKWHIYNEIQEVKNLLNDQRATLDYIACDENLRDFHNGVERTLDSLGQRIDEISQNTATLKDSNTDEIRSEIKNVKNSIIELFLNVFEQISFVEEAEDIKDFVQAKTQEVRSEVENFSEDFKQIKNLLMTNGGTSTDTRDLRDIKGHLEDLRKQVLEIRSTEGSEGYVYTLQDVETDISKLRLTLNEVSKTMATPELDEISDNISDITHALKTIQNEMGKDDYSDFDKLTDDLESISVRTNKLLLTSDESSTTLQNGLQEFKEILNDIEETVSKSNPNERLTLLEQKLDGINSISLSMMKSDKVLNEAFMYLAEWIDSAGAKLDLISENMTQKSIIKELETKFNAQEKQISSLEKKLEKVLSTLEATDDTKLTKKVDGIDKQLAKLSKNIEKLTSYVDE